MNKKLDKFKLRRLANQYNRLLKLIELLEEFKYSIGSNSFTPLINELFFGAVYYMGSLFNLMQTYNPKFEGLFIKYFDMEGDKKEFEDFKEFNIYFEDLKKDFELIKGFVERGEI